MKMPEEKIDPMLFAPPCGMNCLVCYKHCYHKKSCGGCRNSEFVGRYGLERFMEGQKEKYTCPICGGVISVHDGECSECQEKV